MAPSAHRSSQHGAFRRLVAVAALMPCAGALAAPRISLIEAGKAGRPAFDYAQACPMRLPSTTATPATRSDVLDSGRTLPSEAPGFSAGSPGDGRLEPERLLQRTGTKNCRVPAENTQQLTTTPVPQAFGTVDHPFTSSRIDLPANAPGTSHPVSRYFPFRATGKLFIAVGLDTYHCSASLIRRGLAVTAAHCVSSFGGGQVFTDLEFIPAYRDGIAPYGRGSAQSVAVPTAYLSGADVCASGGRGVVCRNDIAVVTLRSKKDRQGRAYFPGDRTGWYSYGWNGFGYSARSEALISQLGYPVTQDAGALMQRNDSQAFVSVRLADNSIIGTPFGPGASGGPWVVNLGFPAEKFGAWGGFDARYNTVVGVTSWGYVNGRRKEQGASPFLSGNIRALVSKSCKASPAACSNR